MSLVEEIKKSRKPITDSRNSMGCSENWYDTYYAIANTFTDEELDLMSEEQIKSLVKLAESIQEALY